MRKTLLTALIMGGAASTFAQQLQVGVPVSKLLANGNYSGVGNCTGSHDVTVSLHQDLMPLATGLETKLIITSFSGPAGSLMLVPGGTVTTGDTLTLGANGLVFLFMAAGSMNYEIRATGTPTVAQEAYYCDSIGRTVTLGMCTNGILYFPLSSAKSCTVQNLSGVPENLSLQRLEILQAAGGTYQVRFAKPLACSSLVEVFDVAGRSVLAKTVGAGVEQTDLNLQEQQAGIYLVRMKSAAGIASGKLVKSE